MFASTESDAGDLNAEQRPPPPDLWIAQPCDEANATSLDLQTEVASSDAFQCINDEYHAGRLTSTEVAMLKSRYMKLHDALQKTRENEYNLTQLVKLFMSQIEEQVQLLTHVDQFPDNAMTEPGQLRAQMLGHCNMAMQIDERVEMLNYSIEMLREERNLLVRDYSRLPSSELATLDDDVDIVKEMERRVKIVQSQCQELWLDIDVLKMDAKRSREQMRQVSDTEQEVTTELNATTNRLSHIKAEWVITNDLPGQHSKETERLRKYKSNAEKELQTLNNQFAELSQQMQDLERRVKEAKSEEDEANKQLMTLHQQVNEKREIVEENEKSQETWYEFEMLNRTEKARLIQRNFLCDQEKKDSSDEIIKQNREIDTLNRNVRRVATQCEVLNESVKALQPLHDKTKARYTVTPKYDNELANYKRRLARVIQQVQQDIDDERKVQISMKADLTRNVATNQRRLLFLEHTRAENWELFRLTASLGEGLGKAVRDYNEAKKKHDRIVGDLEARQVELAEQGKTLDALMNRLHVISELYAQTKLERNKCVGALKTALKVGSDYRDRLRLIGNEVDILTATLQVKDQGISKEHMLMASSVVQRDHKRYELCQVDHLLNEQISRRAEIKLRCQRINAMFGQVESESLSIKRVKERSAKLRNEQAIALIERNQEVYVLQERLAAQRSIEEIGKVELRGLEEEIEFAKSYKRQLESFNAIHKNVDRNQSTEQIKRDGLIHQLIGARAELARLIKMSENPDTSGRLNFLGGKDPSPAELWIQLGRIERRMAAKEEEMAERNLTYEAVCRLVDSLQTKASSGKMSTLNLATRINDVKNRIHKLTDQMKTMHAELVLRAGERDRLDKAVKASEINLDMYHLRLHSGQVPKKEWQLEWKKQHEKARRHSQDSPSQQPRKIVPMRPSGLRRSDIARLVESHYEKPNILTWCPASQFNQNKNRGAGALQQHDDKSGLPCIKTAFESRLVCVPLSKTHHHVQSLRTSRLPSIRR